METPRILDIDWIDTADDVERCSVTRRAWVTYIVQNSGCFALDMCGRCDAYIDSQYSPPGDIAGVLGIARLASRIRGRGTQVSNKAEV